MNKKWIAGETSISRLPYNEREKILGNGVSDLIGFEFYKGGIYEPFYDSMTPKPKLRSSNTFVSHFDWRNRHGINWNTPVSQQFANTCWAFSAVAATEAFVNLYYNREINTNLSEGLVAVSSYMSDCSGGFESMALQFIELEGVVDDSCFKHQLPCTKTPSDTCEYPSERIKIGGRTAYQLENISDPEVFFKQLVISKGVVCGNVRNWLHSMALTGFGTIEEGNVYHSDSYGMNDSITILPGDSLIARTYWIFKNSWGTDWGDEGYGYVIVNNWDEAYYYSINSPIFSRIFNDSDIVCEDRDGDGYYFWDIGSRPTYCPANIMKDGDDSNNSIGQMDEYGNLEVISTPYS